MMFLVLASGLVILLLAGDILVRGAVALALRFNVPRLIVGLTVVAFGTSAPELVICVKAALEGAAGIAIGNVVGSNIANVLLVLGLPAIIYPTLCDEPGIRRNTVLMIASTILFIVLCFTGILAFYDGLLMFTLIIGFLAYAAHRARSGRTDDPEIQELTEIDEVAAHPHPPHVVAGQIIAGLIGLPLGASLIVDGATDIALAFGVSEAVIGLTIIAFGTSLPELATTLAAAFRRQSDVAVGNVLGSNIFNILAIMGVTAMIAPIPIPEEVLRVDLWIMLATALLIVPFALLQARINRGWGASFVLAYIAYVYYLFEFGSAA